jgi:hypothetical protein
VAGKRYFTIGQAATFAAQSDVLLNAAKTTRIPRM